MSANGPEPIFIVDHMLGSLARWLRMLGYDSRYEKELSDNEILGIARKESRHILTRDKELAERGKGLFVPATDLDEQLSLVAKEFSLSFRPERMRCSVCNGRLLPVDAEEAKHVVPDKSYALAKDFWRCESCRKVYWSGTHWEGIMDRFRRLGLIKGDVR